MKSSFLGKALMAVTLLALSVPASARVIDLGDLVSTNRIAARTSANSANTGRFVVRGNANNRFADVFKFSLSKDADFSFKRLIGDTQLGRNINLKTAVITLRDSSNRLIMRGAGGRVQTFADNLDTGAYRVRIGGALTGGLRGAYKFNAHAIAAPVPEPEEWALMILGSGLMAYQVRRKQRKLAIEGDAALPA